MDWEHSQNHTHPPHSSRNAHLQFLKNITISYKTFTVKSIANSFSNLKDVESKIEVIKKLRQIRERIKMSATKAEK